ncbi:hypothetical protein AURDEDRAFT_114660 [Auricularia subglabra TFB-10046 SS5]|nr:hypothetical protein AURDEDRAFT_114660 [Auricularia subglabra TFB-10046 SS5]
MPEGGSEVHHFPEHLWILEGDTGAHLPYHLVDAIRTIRPNSIRYLVVHRANTRTIDSLRYQYVLLHRATILPTHLAIDLEFERARVLLEADARIVADFVDKMPCATLSSLTIARSLPIRAVEQPVPPPAGADRLCRHARAARRHTKA